MNCVVTFAVVKPKKNRFPRINMWICTPGIWGCRLMAALHFRTTTLHKVEGARFRVQDSGLKASAGERVGLGR